MITQLYTAPMFPLSYLAEDTEGRLHLTNATCTAVVTTLPPTFRLPEHARPLGPQENRVLLAQLNR